jgi:glycosyltransferase involved in cell wall biosynthesis
MKVLILATDIYTRGGIARYTYTLASAMADLLGPENVDILALLGYGDPSDLHPRFRIFGPISERLTPAAKLRFALKALALGRRKYDLILCSHLTLAQVAGTVHYLFGTPFWVTCHGAEVWGKLSFLKRAALRRSSLLLPVSCFTAKKLSEVHRIPQQRASIVRNAVPDEFAELLAAPMALGPSQAAARREHILLSVGSLGRPYAYKGFDTVIRALPLILDRFPDLRYVIVGQGDDQPRLENLARGLGVQTRVTFAGSLTDQQIAECYRTCDVFVLPSKATMVNGKWRGEGFGRVYVEASLAGKPVVGSSGGGAAEAVIDQKTGLLVDPSSAEQTASAVLQLLEDPTLARAMGEAGRKWARENFTEAALRGSLRSLLQSRWIGAVAS